MNPVRTAPPEDGPVPASDSEGKGRWRLWDADVEWRLSSSSVGAGTETETETPVGSGEGAEEETRFIGRREAASAGAEVLVQSEAAVDAATVAERPCSGDGKEPGSKGSEEGVDTAIGTRVRPAGEVRSGRVPGICSVW
jgi:hypothetical protein